MHSIRTGLAFPPLPASARLGGIPRAFAAILAIALVGYAYGGRGFAYFGIPPFFVDSLIFLGALAVLACRPAWLRLTRDPLVWLLLAFAAWGAARTLPYLPLYGIDALRDGVVWAWVAVALAVAVVTGRSLPASNVAHWYGATMTWFVLWVPVAFIVYRGLGDLLPRWPWGPGGGVPVIVFKGGDVAVHLAGVLAFWLFLAPQVRARMLPAPLVWPLWFASFLVAAAVNRGGFLALLLSSAFAAAHARLRRLFVTITALGFLVSVVTMMSLLDVAPVYRVNDRALDIRQLYTNFISVFVDVEDFGGTGTKQWRLAWWQTIANYTIFGEYFWTGKGFGVNLADSDGFQVTADGSLRSPHNGHLTILARMGVPGIAIWVSFLVMLLVRLWLRYWEWKRSGDDLQAGLCMFTLTYLAAATVNTTFDVYLEGPMGGIWFWSVAGFGISLVVRRATPYGGATSRPVAARLRRHYRARAVRPLLRRSR